VQAPSETIIAMIADAFVSRFMIKGNGEAPRS
jgi:hypothetical protein